MATTVQVKARRELRVKADPKRAFALLSDVRTSAGHYPKVKNLVDLGNGAFRWEMQEIGMSAFSHQVVYACRYESDEAGGTITWTPVEGEGNSEVSGSWRLAPEGDGTRLTFEGRGDLSIPVPWLLRSVAGPFVEKEFNQQIDTYLRNIIRALGGEA
jgi:carbon monoxide dehydrogenase subunit G